MNEKQIATIKKELKIELSDEKIELLKKYEKSFLDKNSKVNLISKNDEKLLFEKHIFDSLAFDKAFKKVGSKPSNILDIGTGGGFPSVLLSILYPDSKIFALDSIRKKITAIEGIKQDLNLKNLEPICERAEKLPSLAKNSDAIPKSFDIVTSRAVASMDLILQYAFLNLKKDGYFIAFKSKKYKEELEQAKGVMKNLNAKLVEVIEYNLPLDENFERYLLMIKKR